MDERGVITYLKQCNVQGIKDYVLKGNCILNPLPETMKTLLGSALSDYFTYLEDNDMKDEILIYLIEEEVKARCMKNKWDDSQWYKNIWFSLKNNCSENVVLKLIDTGSTNIVEFKKVISFNHLSIAIEKKYNANVMSNLLKYFFQDKDFFIDKLLFQAVACNNGSDVIKLFVDTGANLHIRVHDVNLFHHIASMHCDGKNCKSKQTVDFLLKNGVDINELDRDGNTILHTTNCCYLINVAIKNGVSIEHLNVNGFSPLLTAVHKDDAEKVKTLLELGADPNVALIFYLVVEPAFNNVDFVQPFLDNDHFFVNSLKSRRSLSNRRVPFMNEYSIADLLLYHGADLHYVTVKNKSPMVLLSKSIIFSDDLKKIVSYCMLFNDETDLNDYSPNLSEADMKSYLSFLDDCKIEVEKMKNIFLNNVLTIYDFCQLKKYYKSCIVDIPAEKFTSNDRNISDCFPIYCDFINIRIKDNALKRWTKVVLRDILEHVNIGPINNPCDKSQSEDYNTLNYDALDYLSKFLNSKDLFNLFLASN